MKRLIPLIFAAALVAPSTSFAAEAECAYTKPVPLAAGAQASTDTLRKAHDQLTIAYLPAGTEFAYHIALGEGIKAIADTHNAKYFMLSPSSGSDLAGQMGALQDATARSDVDAIILISFDESALAPLVKEAVKAGKVVVLINSDIPNFPTPVHGVIGVSQRKVNGALAKWALEQSKGEPRKVGILDGEPSYIATERAGGFTDGIAGSAWNVISRINGGWSVEKGNTAAMDLLQAHPDVQVIYASNDYMALGAALAAKALGRKDLSVFGYDGDTGAMENIAAGDGITATSNTAPVIMGKQAACFVLDLLAKKTEGGYVNTPTSIVTHENAAAILHKTDDLYPKPSKTY
jgi:ribose transport system substrate-binding protein